MKLEGRVALITGAGRNIGRATALLFAKEGAKVVVNGLTNKAALEEVAHIVEDMGGKALPILADVSDPDAVDRMVRTATREFGAVDVVVSNASIRPHGPFTELTNEQWRKLMGVDLDATFYLCRAAIPGMVKKGKGSIVAVSGLAAFGVRDHAAGVATAKAGLIGMMRGVAKEYARQGVRANTVVPGSMATERYDQQAYLDGKPPVFLSAPRAAADDAIPLGRLGYPEELAAACLYLASDDSAYTTGQTLHVGGGLYME
jgi:NAD(P)-dependent dehydrogenase (short-subunit alcohol dehydrogenase family)